MAHSILKFVSRVREGVLKTKPFITCLLPPYTSLYLKMLVIDRVKATYQLSEQEAREWSLSGLFDAVLSEMSVTASLLQGKMRQSISVKVGDHWGSLMIIQFMNLLKTSKSSVSLKHTEMLWIKDILNRFDYQEYFWHYFFFFKTNKQIKITMYLCICKWIIINFILSNILVHCFRFWTPKAHGLATP